MISADELGDPRTRCCGWSTLTITRHENPMTPSFEELCHLKKAFSGLLPPSMLVQGKNHSGEANPHAVSFLDHESELDMSK